MSLCCPFSIPLTAGDIHAHTSRAALPRWDIMSSPPTHPPTHPHTHTHRYADDFSPVSIPAVVRDKVDVERMAEADLDYSESREAVASLRGRLKLAIANFVGECWRLVGWERGGEVRGGEERWGGVCGVLA